MITFCEVNCPLLSSVILLLPEVFLANIVIRYMMSEFLKKMIK